MNISISRNGAELGEWPEEQVRSLYKEGQLLLTDYYWKEGMTEWVELYKLIQPAPAPAPAPASRPVLKTQVISVVDNKFTQKKAVAVSTSNIEKQRAKNLNAPLPNVPLPVEEKPGWAGKMLRKLFPKRD